MAAVRYVIDWPKIRRISNDAAKRRMRLAVAETRIVARRKVLYGPYTTGRLARSIYGTLRTAPNGYIGRVGSHLDYASYPEGGARRHYIRPRNPNGWLYFYWRRQGRWVRRKMVNHPGQRGKHYLRDALLTVGRKYGFRVVVYDLG